MSTKPFEASAGGTDKARAFLVALMRDAVGNDTFSEYVRTELAGDFAWSLANHLAQANAAMTDDEARTALEWTTALASREPDTQKPLWYSYNGHTLIDIEGSVSPQDLRAILHFAPRDAT